MEARKLSAVLRVRTARLVDLFRRFGVWWLDELLNLFPAQLAERLVHKSRNVLVLAIGHEFVTLDLQSYGQSLASEQVSLTDYSAATIDHFLQLRGLERSDVDLAIRLSPESIFCRRLTLPPEAGNAIDEIVAQSLLKKTPFKPDDIYCDHVAVKSTEGNKISVWQWVARRKLVHESLSRLQVDLESVMLVVGDSDIVGDEPPPTIKLCPRTQVRRSWVKNSAFALTCSAAALVLVAGGLRYWHQQTTIEHLESQAAAIKSKAQQVRALTDKLQEKQNFLFHLRRDRDSAPGLIDLWEEATRVLPSHTWLSELRLEASDKQEQQMVIIGFSAAAPSLVGIIDNSWLFFDAALTAPISLDPVERLERFALKAKVVRSSQGGKAAQ